MHIRRYQADDADAVVELSLLAWAPVFASFERVMGPTVYRHVYPDWTASQRAAVLQLCTSDKMQAWVAEHDGTVAGFIVWDLNHDDLTSEVHLLAVHPDAQRQGVGTALNTFALEQMKDAGMTLAHLMTGGDPGHEPARRAYEKAGYLALPLVHYYKAL
jgi:GNAT superfamily N-acetyltransferase